MTARTRRLLWPGLMTAAMLIVLLGLGTWQVQRLHWKEALLGQIDLAETAPPVPFTGTPAPFAKISVTGTFLPDKTALYGADVRDIASGPEMGARLIEALRMANNEMILVDRGWVPLSRPGPIDQPGGVVTVSGYVRFGDRPGWFSAANDVVERRFFTLDPPAIGAAMNAPKIPNFVLVALAPASETAASRWPEPAHRLPRPPNNHLSYAITWYGLAMALLAIFIVWAKRGSRA